MHRRTRAETLRFRLLRSDFDVVVAELAESIAYVERASGLGAKFNSSIVT